MTGFQPRPGVVVRAAVYCRISEDPTGEGLGVARQEEDCRQLIDTNGWQLTRVFVDNDISNYQGRFRPAYQQLLAEIEAGTLDTVVVWHPDRLHRHLGELEAFIDLLERRDVTVRTVRAGELDLSTAAGRLTARIVGAVARNESEHRAERIRRQRRQAACDGYYQGGRVPFGYRLVRFGVLEPDPGQAAVVSEIAERLLAGESLAGVARDLNDRGLRTAGQQRWRNDTLIRVVTHPCVAGLSTYKGEVVGTAIWDPIIDDDDRRALVRYFGERTARRPRMPVRSYLLAGGLARCGRCGIGLRGQIKHLGRTYLCAPGVGQACGRLCCTAEPAEAHVAEAVLARIEAGLTNWPGPSSDLDAAELEAQLAEHDARLGELADLYADHTITKVEWLRARRSIADARESLLERLRVRRPVRRLADPKQLRSAWPDLTLDGRRAVLSMVIDHITVAPVGKGGRFRPDRLTITWRTQPQPAQP